MRASIMLGPTVGHGVYLPTVGHGVYLPTVGHGVYLPNVARLHAPSVFAACLGFLVVRSWGDRVGLLSVFRTP